MRVGAWQVAGRAPPSRPPLSQRAEGDRRPVVLTTLLAADPAARERALRRAARFRLLRTVIVTDEADLAPFATRGLAVEHLPATLGGQVGRRAGAGPWRDYLAGRWLMLRAKWEPVLVVEDGVPFGDWVDGSGPAGRMGQGR